MPEGAGEYVDIPALLKGILNAYPGNSAILREYLQNSDDATATSQVFILDERTFPKKTVLDPALKDRQGPSLIAINDGILDEADWKALQSIHSSSKALDDSRTGKNGLGFRASYHLTENPHLLSGRKLVILDAHREFSKHPGGVAIDTITEGSLYKDQLAPFLPIVGNFDHPFPGTVFRLPLRTKRQAQTSRITDASRTVSDVLELLHSFCSDELEEVILFLKHVTSIEVRHIAVNGNSTTIGRVDIERRGGDERTVRRCVTVKKPDGTESSRFWWFHYDSVDPADAVRTMNERLGYSVEEKLHVEKLIPIVELAFPCDTPLASGNLFTLLPLPIRTGFPLHLNAVFALTPDRQNLKNAIEVGGKTSRERLLVEWNKVIFETWVPTAWGNLLSDLVKTPMLGSQIWLLWPPEQRGEDTYWADLAYNTAVQAVNGNLGIFPTIPGADGSAFTSLQDSSVLLVGPEPNIDLNVLAGLKFGLVQPPPYLFSILQSLSVTFSAAILSPQSLHQLVLEKFPDPEEPPCRGDAARTIVDYLASLNSGVAPTLAYISGVRWFTLVDGSLVSIGSALKNYIVPASADECDLFKTHNRMLSWDCMSQQLRTQVSLPNNIGSLNLSYIKPSDVISVLRSRLGRLPSHQDAIDPTDHAWAIRFWKWVSKWTTAKEFFKQSSKFSNFYLFPTTQITLRKFSNKAIVFHKIEEAGVQAWGILGVYPLHDDLSDYAFSKLKAFVESPRTPGYIPFLIKTCDVTRQDHLSQDALLAIQGSLYAGLSLVPKITLTDDERNKLSRLRVFKLQSRSGNPPELGAIDGKHILVDVENDFPLPCQLGSICVDVKDPPTKALLELIKPLPLAVSTKLDLLDIAFDNWAQQSTELQDRFIEWIFNLHKVPARVHSRLNSLPFISVEGQACRVPPTGLIDPDCDLRSLYRNEEGKLPTGRYAGDYLLMMRKLGFVHSALNVDIVKERLRYLSKSTDDPDRFQKAKDFVILCNRFWTSEFHTAVVQMRAESWLPLEADPPILEAPEQCRDSQSSRRTHEDPHFYDLALHILPADIQITSLKFREALGWADVVDSEVLVAQFRLTVELAKSRKRNERLIALIEYFGLLQNNDQLSSKTIRSLLAVSVDKPWIPVSSKVGSETVMTKHALLSGDTGLTRPFRQVHDFEYPTFLEKMGCTPRPKFESLVDELRRLNFKSRKEVDAGISLLHEITNHHHDFDRESILVPGDNKRSLTLEEVYFCDTNLSHGTTKLVPAHSTVSRALATVLGIPFLSSIILEDGEDDEDDEDEQMSEDFVARIRGFLREYDIRYAINEFFANADDAKATQFSVLLETPSVTGGDFVSPAFQEFARHPLLVLHNDALLSEADFKGLREIGTGGKVGNSDTHGRHGLGALSLYYFTDVVTVISGGHIMLLDPSGEYLPRRRYGRRTALKRTLLQFSQRYPDQLALYNSLFDFSKDSGHYNGTLFLLPLKTSKISDRACHLVDIQELVHASYQGLAKSAFFFTDLKQISFQDHTNGEDTNTHSWSISAKRSPAVSLGEYFTRSQLTIEHGNDSENSVTETWLITASEKTQIPQTHEAAAIGLKLHLKSAMHVQLAIRVDHTNDMVTAVKSFLFSTLRLPKMTSLPFHLNARFAISSNRQSIVFDPPDSYNTLDAKTAYNMWILGELVPPLYLSTLEYLLHSNHDHPLQGFHDARWWLLEPSDDVSQLARRSFLDNLAISDAKLFKDAADEWLSFRDAVFPGDNDPQIIKFLSLIDAPSFINCGDHLQGLAQIPNVRTVNGAFIKAALLEHLSLEEIRRMIDYDEIDLKGIAHVLDYVHQETPLRGLPLLVLSSGKLIKIPGPNRNPVYRTSRMSHAKLFSHTQFLGNLYTEATITALFDDETVNVIELTDANVIDLIKHELKSLKANARSDWLDSFWEVYLDLPGPPSLESLSSLKIIQSRSAIISLDECIAGEVVYTSSPLLHNMDWLVNVFQHFELDLLEGGKNPILDKYMDEKFSDFFSNVLLCLESKGIAAWSRLSQATCEEFSEWIRNRLSAAIYLWKREGSNISKPFLLGLPIWEAQNNRGDILHPASGLKVVPSFFDLQYLLPYQKPGSIVAPFSAVLSNFMEFCCNSSLKTLSPTAIKQLVQLPLHIAAGDDLQVKRVKDFVRAVLQYPWNEVQDADLKIPDQEGTLRPVGELHDSTVNLFAETLKYTEQSSFAHPSFGTLQPQLRHLGLIHEVNLENFRVCATAVQGAFESPRNNEAPDRNSILEMANVAFRVYHMTLPALIMTNVHSWSSLDDLAFVRRMGTRRQGASYDVDRYCDELPAILSPSCYLRRNLEPIAWTQRALFSEEPSEELLAVNQRLGIPSVKEVVNHLKVLSTRIALDHPRNATLLSDLKATYKWLNDHFEEAQEDLLLIDDMNLFLNVDDPAEDNWSDKWVTAKTLVLNLHYDFGQFKCVGNFLQDYDKLLLAAGSTSLKSFERKLHPEPTQGSATQLQDLRNTFKDMRQGGELTDVALVPFNRSASEAAADGDGKDVVHEAVASSRDSKTYEQDQETPVKKSDLRAHRVFLAALIPHVRHSAQGWMTKGEIPFYGSAVGAKALLDFIYTGEFDLSTQTTAIDKLERLLCDLLELLPIADEWDMPDLMAKLEYTIIHRHDMIQRLPFQHQNMLTEAEKYHANTLRDALNEFRNQNPILFQD